LIVIKTGDDNHHIHRRRAHIDPSEILDISTAISDMYLKSSKWRRRLPPKSAAKADCADQSTATGYRPPDEYGNRRDFVLHVIPHRSEIRIVYGSFLEVWIKLESFHEQIGCFLNAA